MLHLYSIDLEQLTKQIILCKPPGEDRSTGSGCAGPKCSPTAQWLARKDILVASLSPTAWQWALFLSQGFMFLH